MAVTISGAYFTGGGMTIIIPEPAPEPTSNAWDIEYADISSNTSQYWDITTAEYINQATTGFGANPSSFYIDSTGTRLFTTDSGQDSVRHYSLSIPWRTATKTEVGSAFDVSGQLAQPTGLHFKPDGTKMFLVGQTSDAVFEYDLSTGWDTSTASYSNVTLDLSSYEATPKELFFKSDGTKMYITGASSDDIIEFDLSSAWDLSTASYSTEFSVNSQEANPNGLFFKSDGTQAYIIGTTGDSVYKYTMSSAWDASTLSYTGDSFSVNAQEGIPTQLWFKSDGSILYVVGVGSDAIQEYLLGPTSFSIKSEEASPFGLSFKPDGTKMYVVGNATDSVYEYDLSTAWDQETASYTNNSFSFSSQETTPQQVAFKSDGTKMYVVGSTSDGVFEYSLSTAWDVSTASYTNNSFTSIGEASPQGMFFKSDGTQMWITGSSGDDVQEFTMDPAWDITTCSAGSSFSVNSQEATPSGLSFNSDGTKMYIVGYTSDAVHQYDLSSAWDVSTATFSKSLDIHYTTPVVRDIFFKSDGTAMYFIGPTSDKVSRWDIS